MLLYYQIWNEVELEFLKHLKYFRHVGKHFVENVEEGGQRLLPAVKEAVEENP